MKDEDRTKSQLLDELRKMRRRVAQLEDLEREQATAEQRLRLLSSAVEQTTAGIALSDLDGNLLFVNNAFAAMHGYTPDELLGRHLSVFHTAEQMKSVEAANRQVKENGSFSGDIWHVRRDGTVFPTLMHNSLLRNESGEPLGMIGTLRDITDLKKKEEDLGATKEELHQLVSLNPAIIYRSKTSGDYGATFISENTLPLLGYSPQEFVENSSFWAEHIHPEDRPRIFAELPQVLEKGHHVHEYRFQHGDGSYRWMHDELRLVRDADGNPQEIIGYCLDITDRKRAERALRESEARYRAIVKDQTELICRFLPDTTLTFVNDAYCHYFRKDSRELIGKSFLPLIPDEEHERVGDHFASLSRDNPVATHEHRVVSPEGEICWQQWTNRAIFDQEGRLIEFQSVGRDITDRKRTERALRKSELQYRTTIDSMGDLIHVVDTDLRLILFNAAFKKRFEELNLGRDAIGRTVFEVFTFLPNKVRGEYLQVLRTGKTMVSEENTTIRDREYITETRKIPLFEDDTVVGVVTVIRDITERKRAEEALDAEKERLAVTLQSIGDGVIATDTEGKVVLLNKVAEALTGWGSEETTGESLSKLFHVIHESTRQPRHNPVDEVLKTGRIVQVGGDSLLIARDGTERLVAYTASPIRDAEENTIGVVLAFRDVTEKRRMEEELLKAQKLEAIGVIAGGIAHDFGNILTAATGKIFLAKVRARSDPELSEKLAAAEKAIFQAKHLTRQLLTFSKGGAPIKRSVSISELIQETADFALSGSNVKSEFRIPDGLWAVEVDVGQISQVINNLIINAVQAMPEGGELTVSAENIAVSKHNRLPLKEGKYVKISVQDRGTGIPQEHLDKIFDPYFTTKPDGSGLGLATAYTIVNRHSGYIAFESQPGTGSIFEVYLPASGKPASEKERVPDAAVPGSGRILLMDDDEEIRSTTGEVLRELGFEVDFARDGAEAIECFAIARQSGHPYHAVILDLTVAGGIGGVDTMKRLLEIDPHVKALVSSGYSTGPITADYRKYGFRGALTKPYKAEELSQELHRMLRETGT